MIEARIIETTKRFTREFGIDWGFDGVASAATANLKKCLKKLPRANFQNSSRKALS